MELLTNLESTTFSTWLRESGTVWAYPTVLTLHTLGLGVLVGANWALDFRVLGWGADVPLAPLKSHKTTRPAKPRSARLVGDSVRATPAIATANARWE